MPIRLVFVLTLLLALLPPIAGRAQAPLPPRPDDEITLSLRAEGFVETGTARIIMGFDTALEAAGIATMRDRLKEVLGGVATDADWRFTRFDRVVDPAGLERWRVEAEARLPEAALGGLADKAKAASRPGLQVHLAGIDFTPTLEEREAGYAKLRADIYAQAEAELARLKAAVPDRPYRIKRVGFQAEGEPPRPVPLAAMRAEPQAAQAQQSFAAEPSVARYIALTALVTLAAVAPQ
jgi:hypothetical protein